MPKPAKPAPDPDPPAAPALVGTVEPGGFEQGRRWFAVKIAPDPTGTARLTAAGVAAVTALEAAARELEAGPEFAALAAAQERLKENEDNIRRCEADIAANQAEYKAAFRAVVDSGKGKAAVEAAEQRGRELAAKLAALKAKIPAALKAAADATRADYVAAVKARQRAVLAELEPEYAAREAAAREKFAAAAGPLFAEWLEAKTELASIGSARGFLSRNPRLPAAGPRK